MKLKDYDLMKYTGFVHRAEASNALLEVAKQINHIIVCYENGQLVEK